MIDVQLTGQSEAIVKIQGLQKGCENAQAAFDAMAPGIVQELVANFPAEGSLLGDPWEPRKYDGTAKENAWPILDKTGKMKQSWQSVAESNKLTITNMADYATYHNFGTAFLPIRKIVGFSDAIIQIIQQKFTIYLKNFI